MQDGNIRIWNVIESTYQELPVTNPIAIHGLDYFAETNMLGVAE